MDNLEQLVNNHADEQQKKEFSRVKAVKIKSLWLYLIRALVTITIGFAFLQLEHYGLVARELSVPVAEFTCMVSCFHMGQYALLRKLVR